MSTEHGLRERKKAQQRELIADTAAALFGERGFDAVSISDVARAANVSDQTVYNYFPTKPDLVLDLADEYRERYAQAVRDRSHEQSPAQALWPLVSADIDVFLEEEPALAKGEFPALCLQSSGLRRFALELRDQQAVRLAEAIETTDPDVPPIVARAHAAALVSIIQSITDAVGAAVIHNRPPQEAAAHMRADANIALDHLDRVFRNSLTSLLPQAASPSLGMAHPQG